MRIKLIIVKYQDRYPGETMPNVVDAWDEYALEDNYEGFEESLRKYEVGVPNDYDAVRTAEIIIPDDAILGLFKTPTIPAVANPGETV